MSQFYRKHGGNPLKKVVDPAPNLYATIAGEQEEWRGAVEEITKEQRTEKKSQDKEIDRLKKQVREANARARKLEQEEDKRRERLQQLIKRENIK